MVVTSGRRRIYGEVYTKGSPYGFTEYELDFDSPRAREFNKHGGRHPIDYSSLVYPHSEKSEMYKYRYCWKQPLNCRDIKIDRSLTSIHPLTSRGGSRGVSSDLINYYGRSGPSSGKTIITFINHNPIDIRIFWVDENGVEQEKGKVRPNSIETH